MNIRESERLGRKATAARLRFEAALANLRKAAAELEESDQQAILMGRTSSGEGCFIPVGSHCRIEYRPARKRRR